MNIDFKENEDDIDMNKSDISDNESDSDSINEEKNIYKDNNNDDDFELNNFNDLNDPDEFNDIDNNIEKNIDDTEDIDDEFKLEEDDIEANIINNEVIQNNQDSEYNFDDDEDDDFDEEYLQKFNKESYEKVLDEFHPELKIHNIEEIKASCKIIRNNEGVIVDPLHKTLPFITCYEKTRVIGERAKQINQGAKPFVEVEPSLIDGYLIALKEYQQKKIPFIIQRPLPNGTSEYWRVSDLEFLE